MKVDDDRTLAVNFQTAAKRFRLIQDDNNAPAICLYRGLDGTDTSVDALLGRLRNDGPERWLMRRLQRYTVTILRRDAERLLQQRDIEEIMPGLYAQFSDLLYHPTLGLLTDEAASAVPAPAWVV